MRQRPEWKPVDGLEDYYTLTKAVSCWRKGRRWYATRPGVTPEEGLLVERFRSKRAAMAWAEEDVMRRWDQALEKDRLRAQMAATGTWGEVPVNDRMLTEGQIWGLKNPRLHTHQVKIMDVRKETVVVLVREMGEPWGDRDVRGIQDLLRLYRYIGRAGDPAIDFDHVPVPQKPDLPIKEKKQVKQAPSEAFTGVMLPLF